MKNTAVAGLVCLLVWSGAHSLRAQQADGPTDARAQKNYASAMNWLKAHDRVAALDSFKKADKQDGGHCLACQKQILKLALEIGDFKAADAATQEMIAEAPATDANAVAMAHYQRATVFLREAVDKKKDDFYTQCDTECKAALTAYKNFPAAEYVDGLALAHLRQDDAAKAAFEQYAGMIKGDPVNEARAARYIERPELARARMAPPFAVTTLDGQHISLDGLQGKVVLIDFWATWCGPCREALPRIQEIAKKFQGQPLVILSVSLDDNEAKWKDFVAKNNMSWLQYRDGGWNGPIATLFGVREIPHTFTIDPDGVLEDEHVGDASIEGRLKKLCARARELEELPKTTAAAGQ